MGRFSTSVQYFVWSDSTHNSDPCDRERGPHGHNVEFSHESKSTPAESAGTDAASGAHTRHGRTGQEVRRRRIDAGDQCAWGTGAAASAADEGQQRADAT